MGWDNLGQSQSIAAIAAQFIPSKYQAAFFKWLLTGEGNAVINAVAGSGKSKSLVEGARILADYYAAQQEALSIIFCAFNKSIVNELQAKLPRNVICKTVNAIGHGALLNYFGGKLTLDDQKYRRIVSNMVSVITTDRNKAQDVRKAMNQLVSFAQSTLTDTSNEEAMNLMCAKYSIELPDDIANTGPDAFYSLTHLILEEGIRQAEQERVISFNDQIWLPHILNANPQSVEWAFVDECQDLSRAKLELVLRLRARRYVFVGDPRQSIYGFAGADPGSFQAIIDRTEATVLPLSICYRCPKSHIELAKEIVPQIEAHENAIEGVVEAIKASELIAKAKSGDLILCRFTAPLIRTCIQFIKQRIPARVKGRDIGESLATMAREALGNQSYLLLPEALKAYVERKRTKLLKRDDTEGEIQALEDRADGIMACYDAFTNCHTIDQFAWEIQKLFGDESAGIELATIHRAKGLEADNVFLLKPDVLPFIWNGQKPWQYEQEENIEYVALTRAKKSLTFVNDESK